ncbi:peroxisomal targeting signal 1 receptor isoform X2 [Cimex lectularius]|uniref:Peroxisomal targeting signal 1 receptor n=1 Tax=Cimex lectularius TaxID=79782 RepID=A0A8I6RRB3_CIMLE|nr:peroxisomal targeting signal 1 receptor isoform X2 [Cimex lectularius]
MALRKLVEGDCGGANSLVNLTSHFVQDRGLKDEGYAFPHSDHIASSSSEQLVQEFLEETMGHSTQPFRMDSLLAEMRDLEGKVGPVSSPPVSQLTREEDVQAWAQQYIDAGKHFDVAEPGIWTMEQPNDRQEVCEDFLDLGIGPRWADEFQRHQDVMSEEPILGDLSNSEDYFDSTSDLKEVAGDILKTTEGDPLFSNSKFMKFMKKINEGESSIAEKTPQTDSTAEHWSLQFEHENEIPSTWEESFLRENNSVNEESNQGEKQMHDEFNDYIWKTLSEQSDYSTYKDYKFEEDNPMKEVADPLAEGRKKLEAGELPSAVLCFEAAVLKEPENPLAWQLLGTTQAENEQDPQAISALKKCLSLEPSNSVALMSIAVCYTNENFQNQACRALKEWIRLNEKYADLVPPTVTQQNPTWNPPFHPLYGISSILSRELHESVKTMFLEAARRNPTGVIDADVQCGLGVLYNLSMETDKAADCFKAALQVRPNDARMWNRLGATLANGSRSEEAIDAYRSALQLMPGFIRARYNLGIACIRLGAHKEAAEHLLIALNQQAAGCGPQGSSTPQMSDTIWNTLRLVVVSLLERTDFIETLNTRNLEKLNKEFGID